MNNLNETTRDTAKDTQGTVYGYCRVSTVAQNDARQIAAMREMGVEEKNIITEKASGKDFERPKYKSLVKRLRKNDVLIVGSIDRLGRNYNEIIEQWRLLVEKKKIDIVVLDMPILDTRNKSDLTGRLISDLVLQLLSYVAQREREAIVTRRAEGVAIAKAKGVKFGRKPLPVADNFGVVKKLWVAEAISGREASRMLGVSYKTFVSWCNKAG